MERRHREKALARMSREHGTVFKEWGGRLRAAIVYPNTYHVGMSNLGMQSIYGWLNDQRGIVCERVFMPEEMRLGRGEQPLSMESGQPLSRFDLIIFTVPFELDYPHIVAILRAARIPVRAEDRNPGHPLIIGGGAAPSANPEPVAPFFDVLFAGEAEAILPSLTEVLLGSDFSDRPAMFASLAGVPGAYVPSLYRAEASKDGILLPVAQNGALKRIPRQIARDLSAFDTASIIVAGDTEFSDTYLIEIARGCGHACHFCLAGYSFRPLRERGVEQIVAEARKGMEISRSIGLVGSAVSDYHNLEGLVRELQTMGARVTASSLRVQTLTDYLVDMIVSSGTRTLTIAPEAGNERMRHLINKRMSEEQIMRGVDLAAGHAVQELKLYFMIGLPAETITDVEDITALVSRIQTRLRLGYRASRVRASVSAFVPKPHTPFQFAEMLGERELVARLNIVKRQLGRLGVEVSAESGRWAYLQGVLARGDRRLADVMADMEAPTLGEWAKSLRSHGLDASDYLRARTPDEAFPWEIIDAGVNDAVLWSLYERALAKYGG
ncbi:MAG: B12-binding domain-containing radical SAM protein [Chloroflexi bacterium]|nr:B12-binding domain-containing radical SAM protein [Chloroflexota bacterium]